jgi:DNA invertase Pin-like site-specific DNA recombinase
MSENNGQNTTRVFGMTRASTLGQVTSQATQRDIIGQACQSLKLGEPQWLDEPPATSGRSLKFAQRPMGIWALRNLRKGDTLVVTEMRTVGRNFIDQYATVQTFFDRGVRVVVLKGFGGNAIDLSKSTDRLFLAILAWASDEEAARVSERTREGLQYRRMNGLAAGKKCFHYIQAYDANGHEIPRGEYKKLEGHHLRNVPDRAWLDQLCELLVLQKATRAQGRVLYDYCRERRFVNRSGREWWRGTVHQNASGTYMNQISLALRKVRRMAVLGQLPEEFNCRVLAITGDTPATTKPKWHRKVQPSAAPQPAVPSEADMEAWDAETWKAWYQQSRLA